LTRRPTPPYSSADHGQAARAPRRASVARARPFGPGWDKPGPTDYFPLAESKGGWRSALPEKGDPDDKQKAAIAKLGVEAELRRLEGEPRLKHEEPAEEAESCFRRALDIARRQGARSLELRAATSLARVLAGRGRRDDARTALGDVYRRFTEGFDTADLKDAETLLKELL
jgi:hypothetical protein